MIVCEITTYKSVPQGEIRSRHLQFIRKYGDQGRVLMAGRFADSKGAMILWNTDTLEEARRIAGEDPYVQQNMISYELREWPLIFNYMVEPPLRP